MKSYFNEDAIGLWEFDTTIVAAFKDKYSIRLDIMRKDQSDGITWDEMQEIKNKCGFADRDAIEFYPSDDAVINTANCRHIYILPTTHELVRRGGSHG